MTAGDEDNRRTMANLSKVLIVALLAAVVGVAVVMNGKVARAQAEAEARAADDSRRVEEATKEADKLRTEVVQLKDQLAKALAAPPAPASMQVDPNVLALAGRSSADNGGGGGGTGSLSQDAVVDVLHNGRSALQQCYERALKRNNSLQVQQLKLTLAFTVQPTGRATSVSVKPNYDSSMAECIRTAVDRWRFPAFGGSPQPIEAPVTLSPKGS